ncbi:MAG: hypothetical protein CW338_06400 [Clostridiales bacterium]|nr:hypothetical protein [Clostridiales bacterium]
MEIIIWILSGAAALALLLFAAAALCGLTDIHFHRRVKPGDGRKRLACAGDSITNGAVLPGCFFRCHTALLQRMLGKGWHAENYGLNDRDAQSTGDKPYSAEREYRKSLAFLPDAVVLLLGTNDTKEVNWRGGEHFKAEYEKLLSAYTSLESRPRVILCTPPWARSAATRLERLTNDCRTEYLPVIADIVRNTGKEQGLTVIDLYEAFYERPDLLCHDGLHPSAKGAKEIARLVKEKLDT